MKTLVLRDDEEPRCHQCNAIAWINGRCAVCGEEKPEPLRLEAGPTIPITDPEILGFDPGPPSNEPGPRFVVTKVDRENRTITVAIVPEDERKAFVDVMSAELDRHIEAMRRIYVETDETIAIINDHKEKPKAE